MQKQMIFNYEEFESSDMLEPLDAELLVRARQATSLAYAPYSQFCVGAAARLADGQIFTAANQENASYPVTMCAEQTLGMSLVNLLSVTNCIEAIAVSYSSRLANSDNPISPCGKCRQFLLEFEERFQAPIRIIMGGMRGKVQIVLTVRDLLPLAFEKRWLK